MFTEMFVKKADNVVLLLALLEETNFHVRFNTVRLLTTLLGNRARQLQVEIEAGAGVALLSALHPPTTLPNRNASCQSRWACRG